jgi:hypothetical protein
MAVAIKAGQVAHFETSTNSTTGTATLPGAPTAGNALVFAMAGDKDIGAVTLTGFTTLYDIRTTSVSLYLGWKTSNGTETAVSPTWTNSLAGNTGRYVELEDTAVSGGTWQVSAQSSTTEAGTSNSQSTGTTGTISADGLAYAAAGIDSGTGLTAPLWTNSYTSEFNAPTLGGRAPLFTATKSVTAGGTTETTFSYTGTADNVSAAVAVFSEVAAGPPADNDPKGGSAGMYGDLLVGEWF